MKCQYVCKERSKQSETALYHKRDEHLYVHTIYGSAVCVDSAVWELLGWEGEGKLRSVQKERSVGITQD